MPSSTTSKDASSSAPTATKFATSNTSVPKSHATVTPSKVATSNTSVTTVSSRVRWRPAKRTGANTVMYKQKLFRRKGKPKTAEVLSWGTVPVKDPVSTAVAESERPDYPFKLDYKFVGFTSLVRIGTMTVKMKAIDIKDKFM